MQRVILGIRMVFQPVEDDLRNAFLLALFKGVTSQIHGILVTGLTANQDGIALPEYNHINSANWTSSYVITLHLVADIHRIAGFR